MIFSTFNQIKAFYMTALFGVLCVVVFSFFKIIFVYNKSNIVFKNIQLFIYTLLFGFSFIVVTNLYNYGEFNIGLLACFLAVCYLFSRMIKKIVDFFSLKVYYIYNKIIKWEKFKVAEKLSSIKD